MKSPGELKILIVLSKSKFLKYCRRFQGFKLLSLGVLGKLICIDLTFVCVKEQNMLSPLTPFYFEFLNLQLFLKTVKNTL